MDMSSIWDKTITFSFATCSVIRSLSDYAVYWSLGSNFLTKSKKARISSIVKIEHKLRVSSCSLITFNGCAKGNVSSEILTNMCFSNLESC